MDEDIVFALVFFLLAFIPVAGLALRFAVKPLVDSIARLLELRATSASAESIEKRLAALEEQLRALRTDQRRLLERADIAASLARPEA